MLISIRIPVSPNCSKRISQNLKYKKICSPLLLFWFWLGADEVLQRALWIWKVASSKLKSWYNDFKKQQADPKWYSQFLKRAVSRKYSKIWFRFTSEIEVEKENNRNEIKLTYFHHYLERSRGVPGQQPAVTPEM